MKPPPFEYHRPDTVEEALSLLAEHGSDAKLLAGGQSLVPAMNFRLARPAVLVDLNRITGLRHLEEEATGGLRIGAMTTQRAVESSPLVAEHSPLLHETMPWIAHPQIRNRGTIGGSLAHADPAAELPAVVAVLGATMVIATRDGSRRVSAGDFFTGLFATAVAHGELLVDLEIPPITNGEASNTRSGTAFMEVARRHGDFALVGVAVHVQLDSAGRCTTASIALLSVGDGPVLATNAMSALVDQTPDAPHLAEVARIAAEKDIDPPTDIHASAAYRRQLARVLVRRALVTAFHRASVTGISQ
ncbi:MAG: xanthine dehydrogenase family protein subunit M [Gemmatimonadales bacterium]|nr:MAG: xanthine dehydrogenase family protein subunit M [Gemmatimonadales bacterium]